MAVRLTALQHASRETPYVECHIAGPMSPIVKILFAYFFLGKGHASLKFSDRYLEKNFGQKFSPRGSDPQNCFWTNYSSPGAMCLQNFVTISQELRPVDVCKRLENVILASLRLSPQAQEGPVQKFFLAYFSLGHEHYSPTFSDRNLLKNFGEKISPRGVRPPNFLLKYLFLSQGNVSAKFGVDI